MTIKDLQFFAKDKFAIEIGKSTVSDILKETEKWMAIHVKYNRYTYIYTVQVHNHADCVLNQNSIVRKIR